MSGRSARELVAQFQKAIDASDCGAILIINAKPIEAKADIECASNLTRETQITVLRAVLGRLEGTK